MNCPVCQLPAKFWCKAKDYEYHTTDEYFVYYQCADCFSIFIDPIPEDRLGVIYPSNYYSFNGMNNNWAFRLKEYLDKKLFKKLLSQIKGSQVNALDVGGGTGYLLDLLRSISKRIQFSQVVDIDPKLRAAAEAGGHAYSDAGIENFESQEKFHLILALNLIEHVSEPLRVLKKMKGMLADDGIILIKTPNTRSLDASLFRRSYWGGLHCPRHWIIFSDKSFRKISSDAGLRIRSFRFTQGGPFWAFSIIAALARNGIVKTSAARPLIYHPLFPIVSSFFAGFDFIRSIFFKTSQMFIVLEKD